MSNSYSIPNSSLLFAAWNVQTGYSPQQAQDDSCVSDVSCAQQVEEIGVVFRMCISLICLQDAKHKTQNTRHLLFLVL